MLPRFDRASPASPSDFRSQSANIIEQFLAWRLFTSGCPLDGNSVPPPAAYLRAIGHTGDSPAGPLNGLVNQETAPRPLSNRHCRHRNRPQRRYSETFPKRRIGAYLCRPSRIRNRATVIASHRASSVLEALLALSSPIPFRSASLTTEMLGGAVTTGATLDSGNFDAERVDLSRSRRPAWSCALRAPVAGLTAGRLL